MNTIRWRSPSRPSRLYGRIWLDAYLRRLALDAALDGGDLEPVRVSELVPPPVRYEKLPRSLLMRISVIHQVFLDVMDVSLEKTIANFKHDLRPDREVAIWEAMATEYLSVCRSLPGASKEAISQAVLRHASTEIEGLDDTAEGRAVLRAYEDLEREVRAHESDHDAPFYGGMLVKGEAAVGPAASPDSVSEPPSVAIAVTRVSGPGSSLGHGAGARVPLAGHLERDREQVVAVLEQLLEAARAGTLNDLLEVQRVGRAPIRRGAGRLDRRQTARADSAPSDAQSDRGPTGSRGLLKDGAPTLLRGRCRSILDESVAYCCKDALGLLVFWTVG